MESGVSRGEKRRVEVRWERGGTGWLPRLPCSATDLENGWGCSWTLEVAIEYFPLSNWRKKELKELPFSKKKMVGTDFERKSRVLLLGLSCSRCLLGM